MSAAVPPHYFGGKSVAAGQGTGAWIASLLPQEFNGLTYAEPFAGMLGVLLQRRRSTSELVNDADDNLVAWWRAVRDQTDALIHRLAFTPYARMEFRAAIDVIRSDDAEPLDRACAVHVLLYQGIGRNLKATPGQWSRTRKGVDKTGYIARIEHQILGLADRLRSVQIDHGDAVTMLEWLAAEPTAIIYADPPYRGIYKPYARAVDFDALESVLRDAKARVAISGYGDDWDALGWERHEYVTYTFRAQNLHSSERTEVLWCNFQTTSQPAML